MTLTPGYCYESDTLYKGGSAWIDECTIDVLEIIDTNYVKVKVYPVYEGAITLTMKQDQVYNFIDFRKPFQITPISVFHTSNVQIAKFRLCALIEPPTPTLYVNYVLVALDTAGDLPEYNRFGVTMQVAVKGTGTGHLRLSWGTDHTETIENIKESNTTYRYNLPPGTHNLCADLFGVKL